LLQLAYYLMAGVVCCAVAIYYLGNFIGWWAGPGLILLLVVALLSLALIMTFPTIAGFCMYIGGRLSNDQLSAIGQTVGEVLERAGDAQRPGPKALAESTAPVDRPRE
jgi:hypothetical protein